MTDPIEAVARALYSEQLRGNLPAEAILPGFILAEARAAIAAFLDAVREPSDGMIQRSWFYDGSIDVWPAMIDALRAELLPAPGDGG